MRIKKLLLASAMTLMTITLNANAWWADSWDDRNHYYSNEPENPDSIEINQRNMSQEQFNAHLDYTKKIEKIQQDYQAQAAAARKAYNNKMQQWYKQ